MHEYSRALYRALAPALIVPRDPEAGVRERKRLLAACETGLRRISREPDLRDPSRSLFKAVRTSFHLADQRYVRQTIERYVDLCRTKLAADPGLDPERRCHAYSRSGDPCERPPLPGGSYCPSHKAWAEPAAGREPALRGTAS